MRPTINIAQWKLAVNLTETRVIQQHPAMPATQCKCDVCQNWLLVYEEVLPADLRQQLQRLGISVAHPVDGYGSAPENGETMDYRVWYYVVGRILSGPVAWIQNANLGLLRNYITLTEHPYYLSLTIQPQKFFYDGDDGTPDFKVDREQDLIQIDFRLQIPWRIK